MFLMMKFWMVCALFRDLPPGLSKPTGPVKPVRSGSGLPDRFDRKPVETGQIKIKFKIACSTGSERLTGRLDRFTGRFDRFIGRFDW